MAYADSPFGRHQADATSPRFRGQAGFRDEPDFRSGTGYQPTQAAPAAYQGTAAYPGGTPYQGGAAYQGGGSYQGGAAYQPEAPYQGGAPYQPGSPYQGGGHLGGDDLAGDGGRSAVSEAELESAFDEPDDQVGGRDRMALHWVWEALLLVGVGALAFLLWQAEPAALRGSALSLVLILATGYGLLALGAGVTLRAGAPNLAIGPVAVASGVYFASNGGDGVVDAAVVALAAALALGVATAVLVVAFHVPGWAASLAAAAAAVVWLQMQPATIEIAGGYDPTGQAAFLFALVAALGVLGGLLGTLTGVRRAVGRFRPTGDPAARRGVVGALLAGGAIVLSMPFAAIAGVLLVAGIGEAIGPGQPVEGSSGVTWLTWTLIGFGAALAGGTSAFGRRGGVFGTTLAVVALVLFHRYQQAQEWEIALLATAAVAVAGGLVVTRLVETFGGTGTGARAAHGGQDAAEQWETTAPGYPSEAGGRLDPTAGLGSDGWPAASATDSWSSTLPARPAPGSTDPWDDDRWGRR